MAIEGNYINESHITNWPDDMSDVKKQELIDTIEQRIEKLTKDVFHPLAFSLFFDGNGKDRLFLGLIPDIITVTEIKIAGVVLDSSWWTFDKVSVYLNPEAVGAGAGDLAELHLRMKYETKLFPKGMGNIKITGTYGWTTCPAAIKTAAIKMGEWENDNTLYTHHGDYVSEKLGDYSYTKATGDSSNTSSRYVTGITEIDDLIKPFIRKKPIMGAV